MASARKNARDNGAPDAPPRSDDDARREEIARRAYSRYCERGRIDGFDVEDWLAAEQELLQGSASEAATRAQPGRSATRRSTGRAAAAPGR
jgi:hypothetical protein